MGASFVAYVSSDEAAAAIPRNITVRRVAANPYMRLGWDLARKVRQDCADLLTFSTLRPWPAPCRWS